MCHYRALEWEMSCKIVSCKTCHFHNPKLDEKKIEIGFYYWKNTLECTGSAALQHVESSQNRDWTQVPCIGRPILNHWTPGKHPAFFKVLIVLTEEYLVVYNSMWVSSVQPVIQLLYVCVCVRACSQSCPTLATPMDCSPPGPSVHGILQAKILECVAVSFSRGSSPPRDRTCVSCIGR